MRPSAGNPAKVPWLKLGRISAQFLVDQLRLRQWAAELLRSQM